MVKWRDGLIVILVNWFFILVWFSTVLVEKPDVAIKYKHILDDQINGSFTTKFSSPIHLFLSCDDSFKIALYTVINSIIVNHKSQSTLYFHILVKHDSQTYKKELNLLFHTNNNNGIEFEIKQFVDFPNYNNIWYKYQPKLKNEHTRLSKSMNFARFYFTDIFDLDFQYVTKAIYIDVDMIVQTDIQILYDHIVNDTVPIWVPHHGKEYKFNQFKLFGKLSEKKLKLLNISESHHQIVNGDKTGFNTGIYLYDLNHWVNHNLTAQCEYYLALNYEHNNSLWQLGTQPIINLLYMHNTVGKLSKQWNVKDLGWDETVRKKRVKNGYILHWNGAKKPWSHNAYGQFKKYWDKYVPKSYFDSQLFRNKQQINITNYIKIDDTFPFTIWLISTIGFNSSVPLIPFFIQFYENIGIKPQHFLLNIHFNISRDNMTKFNELVTYLKNKNIINWRIWNLTGTQYYSSPKRKPIEQEILNQMPESDYVLIADVDEFQDWNALGVNNTNNIYDFVQTQLINNGYEHVNGYFMDRFAANATLIDPPLFSYKPNYNINVSLLFEQYPFICDFTRNIVKAYWMKVCLFKNIYEIHKGRHRLLTRKYKYHNYNLTIKSKVGVNFGDSELMYFNKVVIHHFKWNKHVLQYLKRRVFEFKRDNHSWWYQSQNALNWLQMNSEKINLFNVKQFNCSM